MLAHLFQRHFWVPAFLAIAAGFLLPGTYEGWTWSIPWQLGGILFCSCLKVRFEEVRDHLRDPGLPLRIAGLTSLKLLIFPLVAWAAVRPLAADWAPGVALVMMMPAGLTSLAFTDLNQGNRVLALFTLIATSLLSPLTVPLLLLSVTPLHSEGMWGAMAERATYILFLLAAPFAAAQGIRRYARDFIDRHPAWWTQGAMMFSILLAFTATAANRRHWAHWSAGALAMPVLLTGIAMALTGLGCWLAGRHLAHRDTIAFACGALFLNNGLSVAFATRFFPDEPRMVLPAVLITVWMWVAMALVGGLVRRRAARAEAPT